VDRRKFLIGVSAATLIVVIPELTEARFQPGSRNASAFNGGRSQIQNNVPATIYGEFPFLNMVQHSDNWLGTGVDNSDAVLDPSWLNNKGYPIASFLSRDVFGCKIQGVSLPTQSGRPATLANPIVITWEGNARMNAGNAPITAVSGSRDAVLNGYGYSDGLYHGRYLWYPTTYHSDGTFSFQLEINSIASGSYIDKIKMYFLDDETDILAGKMFGARYLQRMREINPGVVRFMNWMLTNVGNYSTWALRKPLDHYTWQADQFKASIYPGDIMTNSGNNYSLTTGSFTLADKLVMHVHFNADSVKKGNTQGGFTLPGMLNTLTVSLTPQLTFGWNSHGIANGAIVHMYFSGTEVAGCHQAQNYYVVNAAANTFQVALTSGGVAITPASIGTNMALIVPSTLSLNGSAPIPIADRAGAPLFWGVKGFNGSQKLYGTVVYDAAMNRWMLGGSVEGQFSAGLSNGVPVEVYVALCEELGAHISVCPSHLHMDTMTDYVPSLAAYLFSVRKPWQKIFWEAGNETWNGVGVIAQYALNKGWIYWGERNAENWTGMCTSKVGQAVAAVFGLRNLGATYEMQVNVLTDSMVYPVNNPPIDVRMTSERYVTVGPTQTGYTRTPASDWVSAVCPATYISPAYRNRNIEPQLAFDYYVTSVGNPTQQMADLNAYANSLAGPDTTAFTIPYITKRWKGSLEWARRYVPTAKMFAYEGGWSPDTMPAYYTDGARGSAFASTALSPASATLPTRAASCVVTITSALHVETGRRGGSAVSGNPAAVGMLIAFDGSGMPELQNNSGSVTFDGTTPDATWTAHNLHPNEVVQFSGFNPPGNVTFGQRYYVLATGLTTNTFRFSARRGGTAITPDTAGTKNVISAFVITNVAGNAVTIDCDSSGFTVPTASMSAVYPNTFTYVNGLRMQALHADDMYTQMLSAFAAYEAEGGQFTSQFILAGNNTAWTLITPDIYGSKTKAFDAYVTYNH
jgi:hypothetical protein